MSTAKPPRSVGVMLPRDLPAAEVLRFARNAEELGFDQLWVVEDLGFRGGVAQAAAVLAATDRIVVGIGILPAGARNVAFTAMELATLGQLFPGRVIAGIGHGMPDWMRQVGAWPRSPLTLLHEYTVALRALLRGQTPPVGDYIDVRDVALRELPDTAPPVLLGVRGPKSLDVAGRAGDGVILAEPATPEYITASLDIVGQAREDSPRMVITYDAAAVDDDTAAAIMRVRPGLAAVGDRDWSPHIAPLGFAELLWRHRREASSPEAFAATMPSEWVERLSIVGTQEQALASVAARHDAGATCVVLTPVGPSPTRELVSLAQLVGGS